MIAWTHVGLLQSKSEMIYLPKKVYLIIIHRNTPHILDMSCCHKHQQQRYHHENTKTCMFIQYMYVDILFSLTKAIAIIFEHVATHYQFYKHGQAIMQLATITSTCYHMPYRPFSLTLVGFWAIYNALPCISFKFIK